MTFLYSIDRKQLNHMKNILLTVCAAAALLPFTGCLVAEGHGHAYGHARYETHTDVIVERPVHREVIVERPVMVVRPPEIIIH
jgi:hypothetical protein